MMKKLISLCIFFSLICFSVFGSDGPTDLSNNITNINVPNGTINNTANDTITNNTGSLASTNDSPNLIYGALGLIELIMLIGILMIYRKIKPNLKITENNIKNHYTSTPYYPNHKSLNHDDDYDIDAELPKAKKPKISHMMSDMSNVMNNIDDNDTNHSSKSIGDDILDKSRDIPLNTNKSYDIFSDSNQNSDINEDSNTYDNITNQIKFTDATVHSTPAPLQYKYGDKAEMIEIKNACGISHIGHKENNEDNILLKKIKDIYLLAVADGVGGYEGGDVASKLAVDILEEFIENNYDESYSVDELGELLKRAHEEAHYGIMEKSKKINKEGMATTLVSAIIKDNHCIIANTGDSRAYIIKENGEIICKTKDHSLVQMLLDNGDISEEEAKNHPMKNRVISTVGRNEFKVDVYKENMEDGDVLLMSSDGLHDYIFDDEISKTVYNNSEPENIVEELLDRVLNKTKDNVSIIVFKYRMQKQSIWTI